MTATGSYQLGIDLGTTYTAAAVARDARVEMAGLGNRATAIPSVIHVAADGATLIGEAADRRGPVEPDRVAREFKRRIGDPTPVLIGGTPHSAEALTAMVLRWVVDNVTELEGGPPAAVALTHPANWGPYKQDLLAQAARLAEVAVTTTLSEPEAAAIAYAANERVQPGSLIAVYDLGGGTFDAAVLRKTTDGFEILGQPEGIERLGGIDFDEAVIGHVRSALADELAAVDLADPATLAALTRLRRDCIDAKEALSSDTDVSIPVLLPGIQTDVRLTRAELEQMLRPTLLSTVDAMRRALTSAEVEPTHVGAVLLAGGSSRIPLVAELLSDAFGRPIAVDAHPKHVIAQGAAIALGAGARHDVGAAAALTAAVAASALAADDADEGDVPGPAGIAAISGRGPAADDDRPAPPDRVADGGRPEPTWTLPVQRGGRRTRRLVGAVVAAVVLVSVLVAGAAARSAAVRDAESEPSTGPTIDAVEVVPDDRTPSGSAGDAGGPRSSGGTTSQPQPPAGGQPDTAGDAPPATHLEPTVTEEPTPPTESEPPATGDEAPPKTSEGSEAPAGPDTATDPDPTTEQDPTAEGDTTAEREAATEHERTAERDTTGAVDATASGEAAAEGGEGQGGTEPQPAS